MRRRICRMIRLVWRSTSGIEYRSNPTAVCLFLHAPRRISRPWACRNPCSSGSRSLSCRGASSTSGQWFHSTSTIAHSLRCRGNHWITSRTLPPSRAEATTYVPSARSARCEEAKASNTSRSVWPDTVMAMDAFVSPAVAVTFVVPACAPAFTRPVLLTLAIAESELVQVTFLFVALSGFTVAVSCTDSPDFNVILPSLTPSPEIVMESTGMSLYFTANAKLLSSFLVAVS